MITVINYISELLFRLLDGNPLADSGWVFLYIATVMGIFVIPFTKFVYSQSPKHGLYAVLTFFPMLVLAVGPPIVQMQMLAECEPVVLTGETNRVTNYVMEGQQCRYKDNYYGEFGEWKLGGQYQAKVEE